MRTEKLIEAIREAAREAVDRGATVTVKISENGFFPTEKTTVEITVTPEKKKVAS
jgi:hypothetical protein